MKHIDEWTLSELENPVLIGADEGTHGGPDTVRVYECLDGSMLAVRLHGGSEVGRDVVLSRGCVSTRGRIRWFAAPTAAARRERARLLRYAGRAALYRASNMPEHVVIERGGKWWAVPAAEGGWRRRTEYRLPEHFRRQALTPYSATPLVLLCGIPAE